MRKFLLLVALLLVCLTLLRRSGYVGGAPGETDAIMQKASKLEADLGKLKDTSPEAAALMLELVDLYHEHARVFGLIRVGQRLITSHPTHARHADVMLKLLDGLQAASRNKETVATARQFLLRYADNKACPQIEELLARTLDQLPDRLATADAYTTVWRRQGASETGRQAVVRAMTLYGEVNGEPAFTRCAELGESVVDKLPPSEFVARIGVQGAYFWERAGQYAKSNLLANKLLAKGLPQDKEMLKTLHMSMGENYARLGQRTNAVESFKKARALGDSFYLHSRQIVELYNAAAKAPEIEALVNEYFQKHPQRQDRFSLRSYLPPAFLRDGNKDRALAIIREQLPFDAASNSLASLLISNTPNEPPQNAQLEQVLLDAVNRNPADGSYLRYLLTFDLYRDRMKDLNKAKAMARDLLAKSPSDSSYMTGAMSFLLYNAANDAEFTADLDRVLLARRQYFHWANPRNYLAAWINEAKNVKEHAQRAALAATKLKAADDQFILDWVALDTPAAPAYQAAVDRLAGQLGQMNDSQAQTFLNRVCTYWMNYGSNEQRARAIPLYVQLVQRFPKDYVAAYSYLYAAANYGPVEAAKASVNHMLSLEPQAYDSNYALWYYLMIAADRANDAELVKRIHPWMLRSQERSSVQLTYADSIGDMLAKHGLKAEALAHWRRMIPLDYHNVYSRYCAQRVLATLQGAERAKFLQELIATRCDFHGTYSMWLAEDYLLVGDLTNFRKVLLDSQAMQRERPFRGWGMEDAPIGQWIAKYRGDMKATDADKRSVYTTIRDLNMGRPSAAAQLALLEMPPLEAEKPTPIGRLLAWQKATTMLYNDNNDWDWLVGYAQGGMTRKDYPEVAALVSGMLENIPDIGPERAKAGRDMVAQCYARMGSVGLAIDESSPVAPLLQAALYLRLGDQRLAFDTYTANRALFDKHREQVPVDLILFVCDSHMAAGGEENHNRVEDILRGWLVKFSEAADVDNATKAGVQLTLAKNYFKAQQFDVARSEYQTVKNRYAETPQAIEADFGIGETFMAQKVYDQAESAFEVLANSRDREIVIRAQFLRGVLADRRGDRDAAREIFRGVLDMVPSIDLANQALYHLSEVYGAEEKYIDQLDLLRTIGRLGRRSKRFHKPGMPLSIVVYDPDLGTSRQHGRIPVKVTTTPGGDEETLYLFNTQGGGKGLFRSDLDTKLGQATKNDHVLQLTGRDVIKVDYPDEFKAEFKSVPLSDAEIRIAASAKLEAASSKIIDREKETLSQRLAREEREAREADLRTSQGRPSNQVKPGNIAYLRVQDADRDLTNDADKIVVKLTATSGDQVQVQLAETGPHTGIFEGQAQTGELPAGALASDTAIDHSPLMAIDQSPTTFWQSEPDGATPKWLSVDMKDLKVVDHVTISSPNPKSQVPVRGVLQGSHDGRFWFRIGANPAPQPVLPVAGEIGRMKMRLYRGNYTGYTTWDQVVAMSKEAKPAIEQEVDTLDWSLTETQEYAKEPHAILWQGKFVQPKSRAVRFAVNAPVGAVVVDGHLELPVGPGANRTIDVWLDRGTHDLTIFAATTDPLTGLSAVRALEDPNSAQVLLAPYRVVDFDLTQSGVKPAVPRKATKVTADNGVWDFQFQAHELRHVRLLIQEYLGEAVAINHIRVSGEEDGQVIPTKADILSLANNTVLEIAGGDTITANYTDEFTQNTEGNSQLLTAQLYATYFNGAITPIIYDLKREENGDITEIRKQLIRIEPGEKFLVEIVDYDMDQTPTPDTLRFRVAVNDGQPLELVAQEKGDYTGLFVKEVFTSDTPEEGKLVVKPGDRIYCTYLDAQNTFPGHAVARETIVYVNEPSQGKVRVIETRYTRPEDGKAPPRTVYLPPDPKVDTAKVAFEVPLTVEVFDRDAAKDSGSKVIVQLTTTDGAKVDVECVVSSAFSEPGRIYTPDQPVALHLYWAGAAAQQTALEEGRFVGQVILQLGSKTSPALVPLGSEMPRDLIGGPALTDEERGRGGALITRVLNVAGKDIITATYKDRLRPTGGPKDLTARGRLIANGTLACTDRDYDKRVEKLHVGEKMYLRVVDADLDTTDERDAAAVVVTSQRGEKETVRLHETLAHSGVFTGSVMLKPSEKPTAGNLKEDEPAIEAFFGDTVKLEYLDKSASTESGELKLSGEVPVVIGTDGLVVAFSKTFNDEKLAVETQFHIAESYFELFKSHRKLGRGEDEKADLENGRRVLREVMEDYPNPKYTPRIAYLLGQFAQELKQWNEAIDAYRLIVRQHSDHTLAADAQFKLAQVYEEAKEFDQALEEYVTLAATYPKSPLIANVMVRIMDHFYNNKDRGDGFEIAAQVGKKFLERFEGHEWAPKVAFRVGQAYYKSEKFAEAGKAFDEFAKAFPDNELASDAIFWAGESFWKGKNNADAYRRYQMCRWKYPASEAAKYARGRLALPEMITQLEAEARALEDEK
jgi:TolA-binding protein